MATRRAHVNLVNLPSAQRPALAPNVDIIVIPEYGSNGNIPLPAWQWVGDLQATSSIAAQLLVIDYGLVDSRSSFWQGLSNAGNELLGILSNEGASYRVGMRPFVIIGIGLGGVVLKQAFSELYLSKGLPEHIFMHSGVALLGAPHLESDNVHRRRRDVRDLLKTLGKINKTQIEQAVNDLFLLAAICKRFEQASTKMKVLNVFETKNTKVPWGALHKKAVLVGREFAEIGLISEKFLGVSVDHSAINDMIADGRVQEEVTTMLTEAVSHVLNSEGSVQTDAEQASHAPWSSVYGDEFQGISPFTSEVTDSGPARDAEGLPPAHGHSERLQPRLPCVMLGNNVQNLDFIGRDEAMKNLTEILLPKEDENLPDKLRGVAITGMGGMGKTSLGVEFALRFQNSFDAIFLVQATSEDFLAQGYAAIAFKLGLIGQADAANKVVGRNVLLQWLNNSIKADQSGDEIRADASRAKWLLIFDNADEPDILEDFWPNEGVGCVIITSRNPNADRTQFYSMRSLKLGPMVTEDATKMLFRLTDFTKTNKSYGEAHNLASRLDGFPLALQQISSYVRRTEMGFAEALNLLNDDATARRLLSSHEVSGHTVATVWASQAIDKPSNDLLQVLAFLDPDAVPEYIFKPAHPVWVGHQSRFLTDEMSYVDARTTLHRYSLIKRTRELDQLSVHRLVRDVARLQMDEATTQTQFELAVRLVRQAWPDPEEDYMHDASLWPRQEEMTRQVSSIHDIAEKNPSWDMTDEGRVRLAEVLAKCSWYHHERGNFDLANRMLQLPKSIAAVHQDPNTSLLPDIYFQQAWVAAETMDGDTCLKYSLKHMETRIEFERNTMPALTQSSAMSYSILALAYLLLERYEEIFELVREGLEIYYAAPETDRNVHWPHFFIIHQTWAQVGLGQAADAVEKLVETIKWGAMRFRKTKEPSFKHAYAQQVLASIRFLEGNFDECSRLNHKAIQMYKETVGGNMHHVGDAYTKLAECKIRQSQPENALSFIKAAIAVYRLYQDYSHYNAQLARALFIQGDIHELMNENDEAEDSYEEATDLYFEITQKGYGKQQALKLEDFTAIVPVWAR